MTASGTAQAADRRGPERGPGHVFVPRGRRDGLAVIGLAVAYVGAGKLGIELSVARGVITPVWAPSGISLAALVLFGPRLWPGVALGALVTNATSGASIPAAAVIAVGNTLEAVVGARLLGRVSFDPALERVRDVLALVALAALASTTVSATVGTATLLATDDIQLAAYGSSWLLWWFGDAVGELVVAPVILVWRSRPRRWEARRWPEGLGLLGLLVITAWAIFFGGRWNYPYLIFPLLVWAALRFGQRGAATAVFVVSALAVWGSVNGSVVIEGTTTTETLQLLQALIGVVAVALAIVAATIAERERAEARLRDSLSVLEATLESTADGILVVDNDGKMVHFNQRFVELWGLPPAVVAARDDEVTLAFVLDQLDEPAGFLTKVHRLQSDADAEALDVLTFKDGRVVERYSMPHRVGGRTAGRVWSFRDVTERRQAEEVKARFLSIATHELRNPLTVTAGLASLMQENWEAMTEQVKVESLARIAHQSERLQRLVEDLLTTSRLAAGHARARLQTVDLATLVANVGGEVLGADVVETSGPALAIADPDYVEQILTNFLTNARKYGGPPVIVSVAEDRDWVLLRVCDAGSGVAHEFVPRLFEPFTRAPQAQQGDPGGTGLGLSIARELARVQGGEAWYEDNIPKGACFCLRLPPARSG